jgi:hypothetical protein
MFISFSFGDDRKEGCLLMSTPSWGVVNTSMTPPAHYCFLDIHGNSSETGVKALVRVIGDRKDGQEDTEPFGADRRKCSFISHEDEPQIQGMRLVISPQLGCCQHLVVVPQLILSSRNPRYLLRDWCKALVIHDGQKPYSLSFVFPANPDSRL